MAKGIAHSKIKNTYFFLLPVVLVIHLDSCAAWLWWLIQQGLFNWAGKSTS